VEEEGYPVRRACRYFQLHRSTFQYVLQRPQEKHARLIERLTALSWKNPRYGFRRDYFCGILIVMSRPSSISLMSKVESAEQTTSAKSGVVYLNWALTYKRGHSDLGKVSNLAPELTPEQRQAVCTILFNRDQVIIFEEKAGTGKTRTFKEIIKCIEKGRKDVFACAPSSGATEVMNEQARPLFSLLFFRSLKQLELCEGGHAADESMTVRQPIPFCFSESPLFGLH
jgi:primosomal protein N'